MVVASTSCLIEPPVASLELQLRRRTKPAARRGRQPGLPCGAVTPTAAARGASARPRPRLEQPALVARAAAGRRLGRRRDPEVREPGRGRGAAARRARDEPDLEQERLDDLLERAALL